MQRPHFVPPGRFEPSRFLAASLLSRVTDLRVSDPAVARRLASKRAKRERLTLDGKLTLLAADHPARMVTSIRGDALRMGRRQELLARVARVLACSPFDGVLGTSDVFDDLLMLEHVGRRKMLAGKLMIGSVNRGGLAGSSWELDDAPTGYDAKGAKAMGLDGAKFLLRLDPGDQGSAKTLAYCVQTAKECAELDLPLFLEPLPVVKKDGKVRTDNDREKLVKLVGVASALGSSSAGVWLKLPYCEGFEDVAGATTLPIVLLGGEAGEDVLGLLDEVESAMKAGPNVRGVLMGRNLLYPPGGDPLPLAMAIHGVVHKGETADAAAKSMAKWEGKDLDAFGSKD
jgi:Cgl0159-like